MPIAIWIGRLSLVLMAADGAFSEPVQSADMPVKTDHSTETDHPVGRFCIDINGKTFRWDWPNVPFAAVCKDDEGTEAKPAPPAQKRSP